MTKTEIAMYLEVVTSDEDGKERKRTLEIDRYEVDLTDLRKGAADERVRECERGDVMDAGNEAEPKGK